MNETNTPIIDQEELEKHMATAVGWYKANAMRQKVGEYKSRRTDLLLDLLIESGTFDEIYSKAKIGLTEKHIDLEKLNEQTEVLDLRHDLTQDSKYLVMLLNDLGYKLDMGAGRDFKRLIVRW